MKLPNYHLSSPSEHEMTCNHVMCLSKYTEQSHNWTLITKLDPYISRNMTFWYGF